MSKFIFKFKSLLDLKTQMVESLKNDLGKAIQKLEHEKAALKSIELDREECINQFNEKSSQGVVVEKLKEYNNYISLLKNRIKVQKENIKDGQKNVDNYREQLIKADQEKEMLARLKDKKYEEYLKEQFKLEQKLNDEIISFKYSKRAENEL